MFFTNMALLLLGLPYCSGEAKQVRKGQQLVLNHLKHKVRGGTVCDPVQGGVSSEEKRKAQEKSNSKKGKAIKELEERIRTKRKEKQRASSANEQAKLSTEIRALETRLRQLHENNNYSIFFGASGNLRLVGCQLGGKRGHVFQYHNGVYTKLWCVDRGVSLCLSLVGASTGKTTIYVPGSETYENVMNSVTSSLGASIPFPVGAAASVKFCGLTPCAYEFKFTAGIGIGVPFVDAGASSASGKRPTNGCQSYHKHDCPRHCIWNPPSVVFPGACLECPFMYGSDSNREQKRRCDRTPGCTYRLGGFFDWNKCCVTVNGKINKNKCFG